MDRHVQVGGSQSCGEPEVGVAKDLGTPGVGDGGRIAASGDLGHLAGDKKASPALVGGGGA